MAQATVTGEQAANVNGATGIQAKSLKSKLTVYTVESLCESGQEFYLRGVELGTSNRKDRDGKPEKIATIRIFDLGGVPLGTVVVSRASIIEQVERAELADADPTDTFGPVKIVKEGRSYLLHATD